MRISLVRKPEFYDLELFNSSDIAISLIDDRTNLEKAMSLSDDKIPICSKGIIEIIDRDFAKEINVKQGDKVYFDSRGICEIPELKLFIIDKKNLLIKDQPEISENYNSQKSSYKYKHEGD